MHDPRSFHHRLQFALILGLLCAVATPLSLAQSDRRSPGAIGQRSGRNLIIQKLDGIVIDNYEAPASRKLGDVIKDLARLSRERTPDRSGVNFILSSQMENPRPVGLQSAENSAQKTNAVRIADYEVTITPALRNVTLHALLGAILEVAVPPKGSEGAPPLRYAIEDYAVVIGQRAPEAIPLFTRTFKVDPNTFTQGLDLVTRTNRESTQLNRADNAPLQLHVRDFFLRAGVNFTTNPPAPPNSGAPPPPQKAIFFNDRTGILFVRATRAELDLIEKALQAAPLAQPPARISGTKPLLFNPSLKRSVGSQKMVPRSGLEPETN
jgi:hypothetical protein